MKIGLVTIYQVPNYGSVLQTYATQYILEKMGHTCVVVNYKYPNELQDGGKLSIKARLYKFLTCFGLTSQQRKIKNLDKFKSNYLNLTQKYNSYNELKKSNWDSFDVMAVGSDQVWNTVYTKAEPIFLLKFLPDSLKRISIASSFATKTLDRRYRNTFKQELSKFTSLTVRESNGVKILEDLLLGSKTLGVCLDPTLLMSDNEWLQLTKPTKRPEKYILLYMWTYAFEPRPYIYDLLRYFRAKMGNCTIIALEGYCNIARNICKELDIICAEDSSISEFLDLFAHANLVVTSSFHGSAFAVNMSVPLISIVPDNEGDDRQSCFLRLIDAKKSIVEIGQDFDTIDPYYNFCNTKQKLCELRYDSLNIIRTMIEK